MALQALGCLGIARPGALLAPAARAALRAALQAGAPAAVKTRALANLAELLKARRAPEQLLKRRAAAALVSAARTASTSTLPAFAAVRRGRDAASVCLHGQDCAGRPVRAPTLPRGAQAEEERLSVAQRTDGGGPEAPGAGKPRRGRPGKGGGAAGAAAPLPTQNGEGDRLSVSSGVLQVRTAGLRSARVLFFLVTQKVTPASAPPCVSTECTCGTRPIRSMRLVVPQAPP
jgi:hypothetical protein